MKKILTRWLAFSLLSLILTSSVKADGSNMMPYEETFESFSNNYSMLYDDSVAGVPPRSNGWWLGNSNDVANVSNLTFSYLAPGYPYIAGTQTNVLYFETATGSKGISNLFPTIRTNMYMEMMLRPGRMDAEESPLVKNVTNNCHLAMYVNTNGFLTVYHTRITPTGEYVWDEEAQTNVWVEGEPIFSTQWTSLSHTRIESNDWIRVLIELCVESAGLPRFQIRLNNGLPMTDTNAFFLSGESVDTAQPGGTWFVSALYSLKTFSGISIGGMGMIDDLRIQQGVPLNLLTFTITPTVDEPGSINPSEKFYLVQGSSTNVDIAAPLYWFIQNVTTNTVSVSGSFGSGVTNFSQTLSDIQNDISIHAAISAELAASNTPLWWLASHGLTNFNVDATNDVDADGSPTWQEYQLGTDPTNGLSVRYLIAPSVSGNGSIDPSTNLYVWGFRPDTPVFNISADPAYVITDILTNGASIGGTFGIQSTNYTWAMVSSSGSIQAVIGAGFPPPANVTASDGSFTGKVYITWDLNSIGATNFMVYRDTGANAALATQIGQTSNNFFEDTTAGAGIAYYYWVKASNELFISGFSSADTGYLGLPAPTNVTATDGSFTNKITISWATQTDATGYQVWQNISNDVSTATRILETTGITVDNLTNAVAGIQYWYWVKATNAVATSGFSVPDSGWLNLMPPDWITASDDAFTNKIEVVWLPAFSATGYEVWRDLAGTTGTAARVGTSTSTNYNDLDVGFGTNYYYWVKATNTLGTSDFSASDIGTLKSAVVYVLLIPSVDAQGTIEPATSIWVTAGSTTNFLITASNYYHVAGVSTDNVAVIGSFGGSSYNFIYSNVMVTGTGTVHGLIAATVTTNNNIPYYWLAANGLTNGGLTFEQAVTNDYDSDEMSSGDEFIAGTDPTNRMSSFKIVFRGTQNGSNVVKWLGGTSGGVMTNPYQILFRTNLTSGTWDGTGVVGRVEFTNTWMDKASTNSKVFFYRIKATD
jgi:fibronectin type 3 domain-containing protein